MAAEFGGEEWRVEQEGAGKIAGTDLAVLQKAVT